MGFGIVVLATAWPCYSQETAEQRPNILFSISDDQSWPHASAYGCQFVDTPAFDRVAREGVLFHNAFAPAPQCSPCRASILSGRNPWENGDAAVHGTTLPLDIPISRRYGNSDGRDIWGPYSTSTRIWKPLAGIMERLFRRRRQTRATNFEVR
jgi:hypothetical protein